MTRRALAVGILALLSGGARPGRGDLKGAPPGTRPLASLVKLSLLESPIPPCGSTFSTSCPPVLPELRCSTWIRCPSPTRERVRGLDAFVLGGQTTVVVIRQGATLWRAEVGDAVDRLALASLVWHELAHANGLDERAALEQEQSLWRRFISTGLVDGGVGMTYIARLREVSARSEESVQGQWANQQNMGWPIEIENSAKTLVGGQ